MKLLFHGGWDSDALNYIPFVLKIDSEAKDKVNRPATNHKERNCKLLSVRIYNYCHH